MINIVAWVAVGICTLTIIIVMVVLLFGNQNSSPRGATQNGFDGAVEVSADRGSVITVRKVGGTTKVEIRPTFFGVGEEDHYEDGLVLPPPSVDVTKLTEPELYREYMSATTTARRKYEIIDYIYGLGLTLPLIPGLHEQFIKETEAEKPPKKEKPSHKTLNIDREVASGIQPLAEPETTPVKMNPQELLE